MNLKTQRLQKHAHTHPHPCALLTWTGGGVRAPTVPGDLLRRASLHPLTCASCAETPRCKAHRDQGHLFSSASVWYRLRLTSPHRPFGPAGRPVAADRFDTHAMAWPEATTRPLFSSSRVSLSTCPSSTHLSSLSSLSAGRCQPALFILVLH